MFSEIYSSCLCKWDEIAENSKVQDALSWIKTLVFHSDKINNVRQSYQFSTIPFDSSMKAVAKNVYFLPLNVRTEVLVLVQGQKTAHAYPKNTHGKVSLTLAPASEHTQCAGGMAKTHQMLQAYDSSMRVYMVQLSLNVSVIEKTPASGPLLITLRTNSHDLKSTFK